MPGLTFSDTGNGEKRYIMRGVQSAGQEQVAVYYDEVPATGVQSSSGDSGSQTPDLALVDLERIEVLKGPQGTTFGANSQTGVVRFIVNKPVLDAVEGNLRVGGESLQDGDPGATASATFNLPLIDGRLALRTTAYYEKRGGYVDNVRLGNDNINSSADDRWPCDAALPADRLRHDRRHGLAAEARRRRRERLSPVRHVPRRRRPERPGHERPVPQFAFFDTGTFHNGDYVETQRPDDQAIYSLTWTQDLSWATLTTAGSLYKRDFGFFRDNTWAIISLNVGPPGATPASAGRACARICSRS